MGNDCHSRDSLLLEEEGVRPTIWGMPVIQQAGVRESMGRSFDCGFWGKEWVRRGKQV